MQTDTFLSPCTKVKSK
jgi:hypothetical protein